MPRIIGCLLLEAMEVCEIALQPQPRSGATQTHHLSDGSLAEDIIIHDSRAVGRSGETTESGEQHEDPTAKRLLDDTWASHRAGRVALAQRPLAQRPLAGKPVVEWVLRRASEAEQLDDLLVVLPVTAAGQAVADVLPPGVRVLTSTGEDRLARLVDAIHAVEREGAETASRLTSPVPDISTADTSVSGIVHLRLDCPLLDPCLVDRLVTSVKQSGGVDYATFHSAGRSDVHRLDTLLQAQLGLYAEYFDAQVLRELHQRLATAADREQFDTYVSAHPEEFQQRLVRLPDELDRDDLRCSLRHQDDWAHAEQIVDALGADGLDWQGIVRLLSDHPSIRDRMARLNEAEVAQP